MDIEQELASLHAIEEIKRLKSRYFRFLDTKDWVGLESVFTPDALLEIPEASPECQKIKDAMPFIKNFLGNCVSIHAGFMPEIDILSATTAKGIWAMNDRIFWSGDDAQLFGYGNLCGAGHYHETYQQIDGSWLIQSMRLTRLRLVTQAPPRVVN